MPKAFIVARGYGKMLRPLTANIAKSLIPVANRPAIARTYDLLVAAGVPEINVLLDEESRGVAAALPPGSVPGADLRYFERMTPFSMAAVLRSAGGRLPGAPQYPADSGREDGDIVLFPGDVATDIDLTAALRFHAESGADLTVVTAVVDEPFHHPAAITDPDGRVRRILERPAWGELFTNRVLTGIYLLKPAALAALPDDEPDLGLGVPTALLAAGLTVVAHDAAGYFRELNDLEKYLKVHRDILGGLTAISVDGKRKVTDALDLVAGEGTRVARTARLSGRVILGRGVTIGPHAQVSDAVLGDGTVVGEGADVHESVVFDRCHVEKGASLSRVVVGTGTKILARATLNPLACVADHCTIGSGAVVKSRVKIWPHQEVAAGASVSQSLLWGDRFRHALFAGAQVSGVGNVDLTPEFAARFGAALGATVAGNGTVSLSRDPHPASRLVARALALGLNSVGVTVYNLKCLPLPVAKYQARHFGDRVGLHVRKSPFDPNLIDIRPFLAEGTDLPKARRKEIEGAYFADGFRRAMPDAVGDHVYPHNVCEHYASGLARVVDFRLLRNARLKLVIDFASGTAAQVLNGILGRTGLQVTALNGAPDPAKLVKSPAEFALAQAQLGGTVRALAADLGLLFDAGAEKLFAVDGTGRALPDDELLLAVCRLAALAGERGTVLLPPQAPGAAERLLGAGGLAALRGRVRFSEKGLPREPGIAFAGDGAGGFLFPAFQPAWDAILSTLKLTEWLVRAGVDLASVVAGLPETHVARTDLPVPREEQKRLLEALVTALRGEAVDLADGVRVVRGRGDWALVLPDPEGGLVRVVAEAGKTARAEALRDEFVERIAKARNE